MREITNYKTDENTVIKFYKKTDYEKRLFLEQEVKELKATIEDLSKERDKYKNKFNSYNSDLKNEYKDKVLDEVIKDLETNLTIKNKVITIDQQLYKCQKIKINRLNKIIKNLKNK